MDHRFAVGARVRTIKTLRYVAAGQLGTVVRVYPAAPGFYEVQFDGETFTRIMTADSLAPVAPPPKDEAA